LKESQEKEVLRDRKGIKVLLENLVFKVKKVQLGRLVQQVPQDLRVLEVS
jgi:hypothetical protein